MLSRFIIVCSFAELIYAIYIYNRLKKKKIIPELIFLHSSVANRAYDILKKKNIKYSVFNHQLPSLSLFSSLTSFVKFILFPVRILLFRNKIKQFRKQFKKKGVVYTQGNHIAFEAIYFLNDFKVKKIINVDALTVKDELLRLGIKKNHLRFLDFLNKKKISTIIHFFMNNIFSGNMCKYWHNGYYYRYYKFRKYPNETELSSTFYNSKKFKKFFNNFTKKKIKKNSIIFLLTEVFEVKNHLKIFYNILSMINKKKYTIYLKFHPDTDKYLKQKIFKNLEKYSKSIGKIKLVILQNEPIEFLNILPTYVVGFPSNAYKYALAQKKIIALLPNKFSEKYIIWKCFKKKIEPFNKNIIYVRFNKNYKLLKKVRF
jgi:hypothetical protein